MPAETFTLTCAECDARIGTLRVDADGMHGNPFYRNDDDLITFSGHYASGNIGAVCSECE
jgi:hypothetical protein